MKNKVGRSARKLPFEPFDDWVLLEDIEEEQTGGGLHLPQGSKVELPCARVVKAGPGLLSVSRMERCPMPVNPGDIVYYVFDPKADIAKVQIDGKEYILVRAEFLCGKKKGQTE